MKRTILITAAVLALAGTVIAQPGRGRGMRNNGVTGPGMGRGWQELNLSEEQQAKFDKLHLTHMKEMTSFQNKLAGKEVNLRTLRTEHPADGKAIFAMIEEIGALKTDMAKARESFRLTLRKQLTDEQREIFDSRPMRFGTGRGGRGARGGRMQGSHQGHGMRAGDGMKRGW